MLGRRRRTDTTGTASGKTDPQVPVIDSTARPTEDNPDENNRGPDPSVRYIDYAAMDRKGADYVNLEYTRADYVGVHAADDAMATSEVSDETLYRDASLLESLAGGARRRLSATGAEEGWARSLRRFGRAGVWTMPLAALCLALGATKGWPTVQAPTNGSGGAWLVLTVLGLALLTVGVTALAALVAATPGRLWAAAAAVGAIGGSLVLAPVLGLVGLARPAAARLDPAVTGSLETHVFDTTVARWLGVGGLVLLGLAGITLACAVLASGVLNRADAWLLLGAVGVAVVAAYSGWQFLLVIAAMVLLAASLGLSWTASRVTPDGVLRES